MKARASICIKTPIQVPFHYVYTKALELSLKGLINIRDEQWLLELEGKTTAINEFVQIMGHIAEFSEIKIEINQMPHHFETLTINVV